MGKLHAGDLGGGWSGSLAELIEQRFDSLLVADGKHATPKDATDETRSRRMLFVAVAQGVVEHLAANADAFVVTDIGGHRENVAIEKQ